RFLFHELDSALLIPVAADQPLLLEKRKVLVNRAVGREPEPVADLTMSRRNAAFALELADELQNVALTLGEVLHVKLASGNIGGNGAKVKRKRMRKFGCRLPVAGRRVADSG